MPFQEDASHRKSGEAAQAKSRTRLAEKCQVLVPAARSEPCAVASAFVTIWTASDEVCARARRARWAGVHTASGFVTVPVAATRKPAGSVRATSKSPYSR